MKMNALNSIVEHANELAKILQCLAKFYIVTQSKMCAQLKWPRIL